LLYVVCLFGFKSFHLLLVMHLDCVNNYRAMNIITMMLNHPDSTMQRAHFKAIEELLNENYGYLARKLITSFDFLDELANKHKSPYCELLITRICEMRMYFYMQ